MLEFRRFGRLSGGEKSKFFLTFTILPNFGLAKANSESPNTVSMEVVGKTGFSLMSENMSIKCNAKFMDFQA